ncbi:hypothetical protein BaRGS_00029244 [Batillaria attramentaria]|uniref:Uncharacterized protein n=1 Tax=Batillaria attramentaria TaxID=370345 RepID=A0ABD0JWR4_9CAEN
MWDTCETGKTQCDFQANLALFTNTNATTERNVSVLLAPPYRCCPLVLSRGGNNSQPSATLPRGGMFNPSSSTLANKPDTQQAPCWLTDSET